MYRAMYQIKWRPIAEHDLEGIVDYIAEDSPARAKSFAAELRAKTGVLTENPLMYRKGRAKGTHELVAHPNYILIYRIVGDTVEILRVKHAAQQWP